MPRKMKCEVKHDFGCNGVAVRLMTSKKKGDPVFKCCWGCEAMLRRMGVKLKEVKEKEHVS